MIGTVGKAKVRVALELFESIVSSVYRFGLGVWGVLAKKITQLDDLFADLIRWLFRLPRTTGKFVILANFGRRCAKCNALFLAATQLASARSTNNATWADAVRDLETGTLQSGWYVAVMSETEKRGFLDEVTNNGPFFLSERKRRAVEYSQYCFHYHLQVPTGTSADELRRIRPFGVLPLLLGSNPARSRYLLSFLLSVWRFIDEQKCSRYPEVCSMCDRENSSCHVLFYCPTFVGLRTAFRRSTGVSLSFEALASDAREIQDACVHFGEKLFEAIVDACVTNSN
jgi:hypothetical protein